MPHESLSHYEQHSLLSPFLFISFSLSLYRESYRRSLTLTFRFRSARNVLSFRLGFACHNFLMWCGKKAGGTENGVGRVVNKLHKLAWMG